MLGPIKKGYSLLTKASWQDIRRNLSLSTCLSQSDHFNRTDNTGSDAKGTLIRLKQQEAKLRALSTLNSTTVPKAASRTAVNKDESREFMAIFPDIVRDLTEAGRHLDIPDANKWFVKVLQYNVPGGKKNRGLALVYAFRMLAQPQDLTPENIRLSQTLGWCVEMLQAFLLVLDDIMDNAETRRGKPCWYKKNNYGLAAINDGILLESAMYRLLQQYFREKPYYVDILELFHEITLRTSLGQLMDLHTTEFGGKPKIETFTMDRYNAIVKYKTAYYSFYLPVALAMHMAGFKDAEMYRQAKIILLEMGHFYQVQDDFLDCFGDPEVMGKVGTDIEDGKCSWLAVVALQRATPKQKALFEESYASKEPSKVAVIKELYEQLSIPATYATYEEESYNLISTHIQQVSRGMPTQLFFKIMEKIYRRVC